MKKYILLLLVLLIGQQSIANEYRKNKGKDFQKLGLDDPDPIFATREVPEAYVNESAVVLAQKTGYRYRLIMSTLVITETNRRRIKLLDKAAVNDFSEFYYMADGMEVKINVVKPNGKTTTLTLEDGIKVTTAVPEIFMSNYYGNSISYVKVAVPDLEPGDIIDYYTKRVDYKRNLYDTPPSISPIMYTLSKSYTILKQKLEFKVERGFYVNFKSVNGAPALEKDPEFSERKNVFYSLEDGVRPRVEPAIWTNKFVELPHIKFQVNFKVIGSEHRSKHFLGKPNEIKQHITADEIVKRVNYCYSHPSGAVPYMYLSRAIDFMDSHHPKVSNPEEYARNAYYYLRNIFLVDPLEARMNEAVSLRDDVFALMMMKLLDRKKIDYELYVAVPRENGPIENIIFYDELTWFLKVKNRYIYSFDRLSTYGEPDQSLQGVKAYKITLSLNPARQAYSEVIMPVSDAKDNTIKVNLALNLDDKLEQVEVNSNTQVTGLAKRSYAEVALAYVDIKTNDYKYFGGRKSEATGYSGSNKQKLAESERKKQAEMEEAKQKKLDLMKNYIGRDYRNVVDYKQFNLQKDGRSDDVNNSILIYDEHYVLGDLVKKAGPNYILEVGALLGSQVEILDKDKERQYDINMSYPKTIVYQLKIAIPEGYKVEGLNDLEINVVNETGSFFSTSSIVNNTLIIVTEKSYNNIYNKKEDWHKMLAFLDAAYNFTQKKIVLKKIM